MTTDHAAALAEALERALNFVIDVKAEFHVVMPNVEEAHATLAAYHASKDQTDG